MSLSLSQGISSKTWRMINKVECGIRVITHFYMAILFIHL